MIERAQYDVGLDSQRFANLFAQGASGEIIEDQKKYISRQLDTDLGERLDRAESHNVYQIRDGKLYGEGIYEPFENSIERGIIQTWDGSRENSELINFRFVQAFMVDPATPDGAMVFNPSPPDGQNYRKNYLDVHKKVGNTVHSVRYFSDLSNEQYREKILEINPQYQEALPQSPKDTDFFLNPVVVPSRLDLSPDDLADYILGGKKGMPEEKFQEIVSNPAVVAAKMSIIQTLINNPGALAELQTGQKVFYAVAHAEEQGGYVPKYASQRMEIQYLDSQPVTIGGGGCGSGSCSTETGMGSVESIAIALGLQPDKWGARAFSCKCGAINIRWVKDQLLEKCQGCGSKDILPPALQKTYDQRTKLLQ